MRRYTIFLFVFTIFLPGSLLYGEPAPLFAGAPRGDDGRFANPVGELLRSENITRVQELDWGQKRRWRHILALSTFPMSRWMNRQDVSKRQLRELSLATAERGC